MLLKCNRCSHIWDYQGKRKYVATCSMCKTSVNIKRDIVKNSNEEVLNKIYNCLNDNISKKDRIILAARMRDELSDETKNIIISHDN